MGGFGSHLTGLRPGLMALMTGFCMYQKVRFPCTQPQLSKRTHTGTGEGRVPAGTVQEMLVAVRLWGSGEQVTRVWPFPTVHPPQGPPPRVFSFCTISPPPDACWLGVCPAPSFPDPPQAKKGTARQARLIGRGYGLREVRAGIRVVHQDLEHGAHVEVTAMDGDPGAPCLWAHGRL